MKRPRTTNFPSPAPQVEPVQPQAPDPAPEPTWRELAPIVAALVTALEAMETGPKAGPALKAQRSIFRRQGEDAAAIGGTEAMEVVLHRIAEADTSRAESRCVLIREAWSGLPNWRS